MGKFKVGDKVEVVKRYNVYKVGEVGTTTSIRELNDDTIIVSMTIGAALLLITLKK